MKKEIARLQQKDNDQLMQSNNSADVPSESTMKASVKSGPSYMSATSSSSVSNTARFKPSAKPVPMTAKVPGGSSSIVAKKPMGTMQSKPVPPSTASAPTKKVDPQSERLKEELATKGKLLQEKLKELRARVRALRCLVAFVCNEYLRKWNMPKPAMRRNELATK